MTPKKRLAIDKLKIVAPGLVKTTSFNEAEALGAIVWLWTHSDWHKDMPLHTLPSILIPAITRKQFVLISQDNKPIFYMAWARMNESSEYRYLHEPMVCIQPNEWNNGDRLWFTDWVAPFGYSYELSKLMARTICANVWGRALSHNKNLLKVVEHRGVNVVKEEVDMWFQNHPVMHEDFNPDLKKNFSVENL